MLTRPNRTKRISGDGNCLFRCFSYVVTGSQEHYQAVRAAVVAHMPVIPNVFTTSGVASVQAYLNLTGMAANRLVIKPGSASRNEKGNEMGNEMTTITKQHIIIIIKLIEN